MNEPGMTPRRRRQPSGGTDARGRLEPIVHWFASIGVTSHAVDFFMIWWKKLGTAGVLTVMLAVVLPAGGYATLAYTTSRSIPGWIGDFGVTFEARDWDIHLLSLTSVAHDVKLRRDSHSDPVFSAGEIEFNGSLSTLLSSFFGRGGAYHEITIRHGEVVVERSLTGDINWADFLRAVPEERRTDAMAGLYTIGAIHLEDMRVVYLEHLPGGSGEGVIRTADARVIVDGLNGSILDLKRPAHAGDRPTQIAVRARLADGVIELKADAGLFPDQIAASVRPDSTMKVSLGPQSVRTGIDAGSYALRLYLENIGMGAYGQMVATTQIVPSRGRLGGQIDIDYESGGFTCRCNMSMQDVGFQPNPQLVVDRARYDDLNRSLVDYRTSGPFDICGTGTAPAGTSGRAPGSLSAISASFNLQATTTAPPSVRRIAALDQNTMTGAVASAVANELLKDKPTDSTVTRGLKNVGKGLKSLIGR